MKKNVILLCFALVSIALNAQSGAVNEHVLKFVLADSVVKNNMTEYLDNDSLDKINLLVENSIYEFCFTKNSLKTKEKSCSELPELKVTNMKTKKLESALKVEVELLLDDKYKLEVELNEKEEQLYTMKVKTKTIAGSKKRSSIYYSNN